MESEVLRSQLGELEKKEAIVSGDLKETMAQSDTLKNEYQQLEQEIAGLDAEILEERGKLNQAEMRKGSLEGQINVILEQINSERMHAEHIRSRIQAIARDTEEKNSQIALYREEHAGIASEEETSRKRQEEAEAGLMHRDEQLMLLDQKLEEIGLGLVVDGAGRGVVLDRDKNYDKVKRGYDAMVDGVGTLYT